MGSRSGVLKGAWWGLAACVGMDPALFYPPQGGSVREAKRICTSCPVRTECLAYGLAYGEIYGIWGGTTEDERRRMRKAA
ncbi:WhiB family transcriptional regulator [Nonomuraea helvata]|uniref:Transcriptional regulator WhiB n=2 Tax=Nonomuraea helvata TaxID=37484 RepID=A0ABV5S722_9ACTN